MGLPAGDIAQFEGEALERREAGRLRVEMMKIEPPTAGLMARVLADEAIKPAFQSVRQAEISGIDSQHTLLVYALMQLLLCLPLHLLLPRQQQCPFAAPR